MTAETDRRQPPDTTVAEPAAVDSDDPATKLEPDGPTTREDPTGSRGPTPHRPAHALVPDAAALVPDAAALVPDAAALVSDAAPVGSTVGPAQPVEPGTDARTWRCARSTMIWVLVLMVLVGVAIPAAAVLSLLVGVTAFGGQQVLVLSVLGCLAILVLLFGWRLGLHPRLVADGPRLTIFNPFRTHRRDFADITLFTAGGDGLVVGTPDSEVEAWCIQKSTGAIKAERRGRADKIADELWAIRDGYHQPTAEDIEPLPAEIRFAHHDDAELLTSLERSASMARLTHIFPTDHYGFPEEDIRQRWQEVLADRTRQTMIAEVGGEPAGYASIGIETLHHLGVAADFQRRGIGTELLEAAEDELFADPSIPLIELWVLEDNEVARSFYRELGWSATDDERESEFPPYPNEIRMVRRNPHLARRGR